MPELINIKASPVRDVLDVLLTDKTTKENIFWATDTYASYGYEYQERALITEEILLQPKSPPVLPRTAKAQDDQSDRTKKKAEVFTPAWIVNKMNNHCDEDWFGRSGVFNHEQGDNTWARAGGEITFPEGKSWQAYIDSCRLEITCGEAPFVVSRYDASTGEVLAIRDRVGMLDRKLRVLNENAKDEAEWMKWCLRAFQSVYGYEWQGDNLLLARANLLLSFTEYLDDRWHRAPTAKELRQVANIIAWNFWQMDGLKMTLPYGEPQPQEEVIMEDDEWASIFGAPAEEEAKNYTPFCMIRDWRLDRAIDLPSLIQKETNYEI